MYAGRLLKNALAHHKLIFVPFGSVVKAEYHSLIFKCLISLKYNLKPILDSIFLAISGKLCQRDCVLFCFSRTNVTDLYVKRNKKVA